MRVSVAGVTDPGRIRFRNEDRYLLHPPMIAVADGMGGHFVGDRAAQAVIDTLTKVTWEDVDRASMVSSLQGSIDEARSAIVSFVEEVEEGTTETRVNAQPGAGTTLAGVIYCSDESEWLTFHIGDSRVYLWRNERLRRITKDHSVVQELIDEGDITEEEARCHPRRSVITRAIGSYGACTVDTSSFEAEEGDVVLVCSDGLSDQLDDKTIASVIVEVAQEDSLDALAFALRDVALTNGGRDNVTVALMKIGE
ncbi:MAG: protein phosphatase 2C domain-containing protein [Actinomycetaceae bacterium]|nr:protein phosphatase 2C domain-containing protein [Actinomycetaceae bacterium]